eukprot:418639_1
MGSFASILRCQPCRPSRPSRDAVSQLTAAVYEVTAQLEAHRNDLQAQSRELSRQKSVIRARRRRMIEREKSLQESEREFQGKCKSVDQNQPGSATEFETLKTEFEKVHTERDSLEDEVRILSREIRELQTLQDEPVQQKVIKTGFEEFVNLRSNDIQQRSPKINVCSEMAILKAQNIPTSFVSKIKSFLPDAQ